MFEGSTHLSVPSSVRTKIPADSCPADKLLLITFKKQHPAVSTRNSRNTWGQGGKKPLKRLRTLEWIKEGSAELRRMEEERGAKTVVLPVCWVSAGWKGLTARTYGHHLTGQDEQELP